MSWKADLKGVMVFILLKDLEIGALPEAVRACTNDEKGGEGRRGRHCHSLEGGM